MMMFQLTGTIKNKEEVHGIEINYYLDQGLRRYQGDDCQNYGVL